MPTLRVLALALLALLAPGLASAAAAPTFLGSEPLAGREALALDGPSTLVATLGAKEAVVRSLRAGTPPIVLARVPFHGDGLADVTLAGSSSRIALLETEVAAIGYKGSGSRLNYLVESGPLGGALTPPAGECKLEPWLDESANSEESYPSHTAIALDGEVLAYDSYGCLFVEDFATGTQSEIPLQATLAPLEEHHFDVPSGNALLRLSGEYLAYRANPPGEGNASVVVYDWANGKELYSVPIQRFGTFALQADGTLVLADASSCEATVSTIDDPTPRPLGVPACEADALEDGRALVTAPATNANRTLEWTALADPLAHEIANLGRERRLQASAPVSGEGEVAYALAGCWTPSIYRTTLTEPGTPPPPPAACPARIEPRTARLSKGALHITIACPLGCRGYFFPYVGTHPALKQKKNIGELMSVGASLSLPPGHSKSFVFPKGEYTMSGAKALLRRAQRALAHGKREYVTLNLRIYTPSSQEVTRTEMTAPIKLSRP